MPIQKDGKKVELKDSSVKIVTKGSKKAGLEIVKLNSNKKVEVNKK